MIHEKNLISLFLLEPHLVSKLSIKRSYIPIKVKSDFINLIYNFIEEIRQEFKAFSFFHLRYILSLKQNLIIVEEEFKTIIKGSHKDLNVSFLTLFLIHSIQLGVEQLIKLIEDIIFIYKIIKIVFFKYSCRLILRI